MKKSIQTIVAWISDAPILAWILPGFFLSYLVFFLVPTFLSASVMQFFQYIPSPDPVGYDLQQTLGMSRSLLSSMHRPYVNLYPPLGSALFAPLLVLEFASAYRILTLLSTVCYGLMTIGFPLLVGHNRTDMSVVLLIFITGLISYGFQFELERGQFNVIAVFLAFLAVWIYHYHSRHSYLAYALFTTSVQLKIYPFIFVVMLIRDWRDWGKNLRRMLLLALANVALLFVMGHGVFIDFIDAIRSNTASPYVWVGNHSVTAFTTLFVQHATPYRWLWLNQWAGLVQRGFLVIVAACICLVLSFARRRQTSGIDAYLLLACTIGSLIIPSTSHDYTLSILAAPVGIFYVALGESWGSGARSRRVRLSEPGLLFVISAAYASTLFSFVNKPGTFIIANNFPALMLMLVAVTVLSALREPNLEQSARAQLGSSPEATQGSH